ncbi:MAG: AraC family transcriptional regulator [Cohaesibacter sp.]|nr:AraC family transcriptional regulator [Cohaesibacter sp.]
MSQNAANSFLKMTEHLQGQLSIYTARGDIAQPVRIREPIEDGLKLVISNIEMDLQAGNLQTFEFRKPVIFAVLADGEHERDQTFHSGRERWDIALTMDRQLVQDEFGKDPQDLLQASDNARLSLKAAPADQAMRAIAHQLLTLPEGPGSNMARMGNGLNLAAMVLKTLSSEKEQSNLPLKLSDMERIAHVRELMLADLANVQDVRTLARQVGTNTAKLNRDFVTVTGMTPHAWLQEQRLLKGWHLLSVRSVSVSEAAHAAGYTPAHFSTLFRKRFKVPPSSIANGNECPAARLDEKNENN